MKSRLGLLILRWVAYIASIATLVGIGGWTFSLSIRYLKQGQPLDNVVMVYGFLCYGILALVAAAQWLVLKPREVTFVWVADVAFWLSGFPGYVFFWAMGFNPLLAWLNAIGFAILFFAAIRAAIAADPLGTIAMREQLAESQRQAEKLAHESH